MSLLIQAQTSEDDEEIEGCLQLVLQSARLGLMHESVDVNHIASYTSKWAHLSIPGLIVTNIYSNATPLPEPIGSWFACK